MATGALVSVEEYLSTSYKPACEYIDGVLRKKPMPTWDHGGIEYKLCELVNSAFPRYEARPEVTVRLREGKFLVPDVVVQDRSRLQRPYPIEPVHLCVEVRSPEDKVGTLLAKCEEYHEWGVATAWVIDPETRHAWEYRRGQVPAEVPPDGFLTAPGISISLAELFSVL